MFVLLCTYYQYFGGRYKKRTVFIVITLFINLDGTSRAQMLNMHFQYMKVANVRVRYVATESKGDPVLLIHGLGGSIESWLNNVEAISSHNLQVILNGCYQGKKEL